MLELSNAARLRVPANDFRRRAERIAHRSTGDVATTAYRVTAGTRGSPEGLFATTTCASTQSRSITREESPTLAAPIAVFVVTKAKWG